MDLPPEVKAQLEEQKKQCVFCKLLAGQGKLIYEDKVLVGMLDINPGVKGHMLFLPKEHYPIMQYLPQEDFTKFFGKLAPLAYAVQKAMVCPATTIFVANGGAAGQQSPHFLVHVFPREPGDGLSAFELKSGERHQEAYAMLSQRFKTQGDLLYTDERVEARIPEHPACKGHVTLTLKEDVTLEHLQEELMSHVFLVASSIASLLFEGLQAHGTNLILSIGKSDDNRDGRLRLHILPRWQDDGIDLKWHALAPKPNLDAIGARIKDETFVVGYAQPKPTLVADNTEKKLQDILSKTRNPHAEIDAAIEALRK